MLPSRLTVMETGSSHDLDNLLTVLSLNPPTEPIASEIGVLQSIYGEDAVKLWYPPQGPSVNPSNVIVRYTVSINLPDPYSDIALQVLVTIPRKYPSESPPQLQLLSKYIGPYGVSSPIFGEIIRTFISSSYGVEWTSDSVCVFDGLEHVKEQCRKWYETRLKENAIGEIARERENHDDGHTTIVHEDPEYPTTSSSHSLQTLPSSAVSLPEGIEIIEAEPITDRKSTFVGRACRITDPTHVPLILSYLLSDRRIARAHHPIINAWRCQVGNVLHQDNDDDGETAAGGRLAHLLQILEVNNVLVVVTRYFGGTLLGADRFKLINQVARNALELGGFLDSQTSEINGKKVRSQGKRR